MPDGCHDLDLYHGMQGGLLVFHFKMESKGCMTDAMTWISTMAWDRQCHDGCMTDAMPILTTDEIERKRMYQAKTYTEIEEATKTIQVAQKTLEKAPSSNPSASNPAFEGSGVSSQNEKNAASEGQTSAQPNNLPLAHTKPVRGQLRATPPGITHFTRGTVIITPTSVQPPSVIAGKGSMVRTPSVTAPMTSLKVPASPTKTWSGSTSPMAVKMLSSRSNYGFFKDEEQLLGA